jgi:hypothetical protein
MFNSFLCIVCKSLLVKLRFVEVHDRGKQVIFNSVLYELNLFHLKVRNKLKLELRSFNINIGKKQLISIHI